MKLTRKRLLSVVTTLTIVLLLYFSGPTSAITVLMNAVTGTLYPGDRVTLQTNVTINDHEFIMTTGRVNLTIDTIDNGSFSCAMPINGTNTALSVNCSNGQIVTVTSTTAVADTFAYGFGYGYDYGYAYTGQTYSYSYGYGYSYLEDGSYVWKATNLIYTIQLTLRSEYGSGDFTATTRVYANDRLVDSAAIQFTVNSLATLPGALEGGGTLTEVYMNPVGDDSTAVVCDGEWVEIYNNKTTSVDLTGWNVSNRNGEAITIDAAHIMSGFSVTMPALGYTVVCYNATDGYTDWLGNSEDTISLVKSDGTKWHSLVYSAEALYNAGLTSLITTNLSEAGAVSIAADTYYFKKNASLIVLANGSMNVVEGGSAGTTNPGGSGTVSISLITGWNLVSLPLVVSNQSTNATLSPLGGNFTVVWAYNSSDTSDVWKKFIPNGLASANDLNITTEAMGIWINSTSNQTLTVSGTLPTQTDITLATGWNLVGYPRMTAQNVTNALSSISGSYSIVWAYNASDTSDPWKKFVPGAAVGNDLSNFVAGLGYWVNASAGTLTI